MIQVHSDGQTSSRRSPRPSIGATSTGTDEAELQFQFAVIHKHIGSHEAHHFTANHNEQCNFYCINRKSNPIPFCSISALPNHSKPNSSPLRMQAANQAWKARRCIRSLKGQTIGCHPAKVIPKDSCQPLLQSTVRIRQIPLDMPQWVSAAFDSFNFIGFTALKFQNSNINSSGFWPRMPPTSKFLGFGRGRAEVAQNVASFYAGNQKLARVPF